MLVSVAQQSKSAICIRKHKRSYFQMGNVMNDMIKVFHGLLILMIEVTFD